MTICDREFYARDTQAVARELLGKKLVREINGQVLSGMILETEAYCGQEDSACHAHRGQTKRNSVMFGAPGHAYVYFTYGMHYLLNVVTEKEGHPCAVLIRAILPLEGIKKMEERRRKKGTILTDGPAKLCQALGIDKSFNGWDMTLGRGLWIEEYQNIAEILIVSTPRIGIAYAQKQHQEAPWRFFVKNESRSCCGQKAAKR